MSNLLEPDAPHPATQPAAPAASASPYSPTETVPPAISGGWPAVPPVAATHRTGTPSLVWGIVLLLLSVWIFPRTTFMLIVGISQPDAFFAAQSVVAFLFGASLVIASVLLLVNAVRIKRRNAAAVYAEADRLEREADDAQP